MLQLFKCALALAAIASYLCLFTACQEDSEEPRTVVPFAKSGQTTTQSEAGTKSARDPLAYAAEVSRIKPASDALQRACRQFYVEGNIASARVEATEAEHLAATLGVGLVGEEARRLLGRILFKENRFEEALEVLMQDYRQGQSVALDLDIALCLIKLGRAAQAQPYVSNRTLLQYGTVESDLPGREPNSKLEASVRFARGLDLLRRSYSRAALEEFLAADQLAPKNGAINYHAGMALVDLNRHREAKPYFQRAAQYGLGRIRTDAARRSR